MKFQKKTPKVLHSTCAHSTPFPSPSKKRNYLDRKVSKKVCLSNIPQELSRKVLLLSFFL